MPGFNVAGLGGGFSADGPSNVMEIRRKHRWVFETIGRGTSFFPQSELLILQSASRPKFKFEKPVMHHNQENAKFAGKQDWEPITLTWYDAEQPDVSKGLYTWIETVVNMVSIKVNHPRNYKRTASLAIVDGTGLANERWTLYGTWPEQCDWGELDYTSTDLQTIEAVMSFDRAIRECVTAPAPEFVSPSCP